MFAVVDGVLELTASFPDGHAYTHRCPRESYEAVAHAIEEHAKDGITVESVSEELDLPVTQANVALAFMKERSCINVRHRRCYPASTGLFEDAMVEFCYLNDVLE